MLINTTEKVDSNNNASRMYFKYGLYTGYREDVIFLNTNRKLFITDVLLGAGIAQSI
jgi:hypothetical protein